LKKVSKGLEKNTKKKLKKTETTNQKYDSKDFLDFDTKNNIESKIPKIDSPANGK
jgi:hypothetical protein